MGGGAGAFIDAGDNTYGGKFVVNPSGGLISKGHPLGATGLAQCNELVAQLRGEADKRQVEGAQLLFNTISVLVGPLLLLSIRWDSLRPARPRLNCDANNT